MKSPTTNIPRCGRRSLARKSLSTLNVCTIRLSSLLSYQSQCIRIFCDQRKGQGDDVPLQSQNVMRSNCTYYLKQGITSKSYAQTLVLTRVTIDGTDLHSDLLTITLTSLTSSRRRRSFDHGEWYDHHHGVTNKLGYQYESYDYSHVPTMPELYKDRMIMDSRMGFSGFSKKEVDEGDLLALWAEENKVKDGAKKEVRSPTHSTSILVNYYILRRC